MVDMILPPRCPVSGEIVAAPGAVSAEAFSALTFISDPFCETCGFPFAYDQGGHDGRLCGACLQKTPPYSSARAALIYDDVSRDLVLRFKHGDQMDLVHNFIPWLQRAGREQMEQADMIVPVPLHRGRLIRRRYNQAAVIAKVLAKSCGNSYIPDLLIRNRATPTQGHLNYNERKKNVRAAFAVNEKMHEGVTGKTILLLDDVYTTGSTVKECTKTLLRSGAAAVHILAVARVVRPHYDD